MDSGMLCMLERNGTMIINQSKNMPFTHLSCGVDEFFAAFFMSLYYFLTFTDVVDNVVMQRLVVLLPHLLTRFSPLGFHSSTSWEWKMYRGKLYICMHFILGLDWLPMMC